MPHLQISNITTQDKSFLDFMNEWGDDIDEIFPHYSEEDALLGEVFILRKDKLDVGIFIVHYKGEELHIIVDYVVPEYRDQGIGQSLFEMKIEDFKKMGFKIAISLTSKDHHQEYLESLGFTNKPQHADWYEKVL